MTYEIKYRKEEEMKDSGIEWLGMIPEDWELSSLKNLAEIVTGTTPPKNDYSNYKNGDIPWIKPDNILEDYTISDTKEKLTRKGVMKARLIPKNSAVVCCIGTVGKVAVTDEVFTTNQQINSIVFNKKNKWLPRFGLYSLIASKAEHERQATTVVVSILNKTQQGNIKMIVPVLSCQQKISNFLDLKTAEFDSIISKKELLIEKLEEAKKSLISEVVTGKVKIVDGELLERKSDEMKDSGIEWLGMIPKEWEVKRLKQIVLESLKYGANESGDDDNKMNPRYIRITDFGDDGKLKADTFRSLERIKAKEFMLAEGDILFARSGATVGKTFQFRNYGIEACFAGYLIKATPNIEIISSDYLYFFTKTLNYENWKNSIFIQATIQNIGADKYRELKICLPDVLEQDEICKCLNLKTGRIDSIIKKTKLQIQKLKQAKQSLISEAVTGKIDLRDWEIQ